MLGGLALDAPVEDFRGMAGGVEFTLLGDLGEDAAGVLAGAFGLGEGGCQGGPRGVGEDASRVFGKGGS
jgi:hypothetical protein